MPLKEYMDKMNPSQDEIGLARIPHMHELYGIMDTLYAQSYLPESPDMERVNNLLVRVRQEFYTQRSPWFNSEALLLYQLRTKVQPIY